MYYFEDLIEEIESNIENDVDISALAKKMNVSVYEFRRIFTFVTKLSPGEYIRKRRLSAAALELYQNKQSVTELAGKYGYDSPSAFSRAFKEFHGISPSDVAKGNNNFRLLTRISADITISGGKDMEYQIFKKESFLIGGYSGKSDLSDSECCENVWSEFYNTDFAEKICRENECIYAAYENIEESVNCFIGAIGGDYSAKISIPESEWVSFKLTGTDDTFVNEFYCNILTSWLASVAYERDNTIPNIEVFPADMEEDDFEWEIWVPIKRSE